MIDFFNGANMARPKAEKSEGVTSTASSPLARARQFAQKNLADVYKSSRVELDPDRLENPLPHLPTGSLIIDYVIGGEPNKRGVQPCPGIPRGRVTQVWGHESSGKTTLALTAAATTCANGGTVLYIDWENDIVPDYAEALGVPITDPDRFELHQPETLEDGIKLAMLYAKAGVDLIVFDSIGSAVPARIANREIEEAGEGSRVGEEQQVWSRELPNLKRILRQHDVAVLGLSQIRSKIATGPGAGYGPTTQPQGGNAWKFYSAVRLELQRIKQEKTKTVNALTNKTDDRILGGVIEVRVMKCKLSKSQGRKETFYIRWGEGIDDHRTLIEIASANGLIKKAGNWLTWIDPSGQEHRANGVEAFRRDLQKTPEYFNSLVTQVIPLLAGSKVESLDTGEDDDMDGLDIELIE
jgi:recombination protein RecA